MRKWRRSRIVAGIAREEEEVLPGFRCRCGHEWLPRDTERPHVCPKCKSPRWDKEKLYERKTKAKKA